MKKMKVFLVGILTLVLSLFCLVGCFKTGKYEAVTYTSVGLLGTTTEEFPEDNASYIELKDEGVVYVSLEILGQEIEGEGTWTDNEDGTITIKAGILNVTATLEGGTLIFEFLGSTITFKK